MQQQDCLFTKAKSKSDIRIHNSVGELDSPQLPSTGPVDMTKNTMNSIKLCAAMGNSTVKVGAVTIVVLASYERTPFYVPTVRTELQYRDQQAEKNETSRRTSLIEKKL